MRSWLRATKPLSVLLRQSSAGGRSLLFTDRSLDAAVRWCGGKTGLPRKVLNCGEPGLFRVAVVPYLSVV
jgi:hypothetical protein